MEYILAPAAHPRLAPTHPCLQMRRMDTTRLGEFFSTMVEKAIWGRGGAPDQCRHSGVLPHRNPRRKFPRPRRMLGFRRGLLLDWPAASGRPPPPAARGHTRFCAGRGSPLLLGTSTTDGSPDFAVPCNFQQSGMGLLQLQAATSGALPPRAPNWPGRRSPWSPPTTDAAVRGPPILHDMCGTIPSPWGWHGKTRSSDCWTRRRMFTPGTSSKQNATS